MAAPAIDVPLTQLRARPRTLLEQSPRELRTHEFKRALLTARRLADWRLRPALYSEPALAKGPFTARTVIEERAVIARSDPHAHPVFERGKRHNVRLAASAFDGLALDPSRVWSFWRTLGPTTEQRGYVTGMELRGGCVLPSIGGGLCLLSNALYRAALRAGFDIVERHGHSLEAVPLGEGELWGADATVAWAHIDLRFRPQSEGWSLRMSVTDAELIVRLECAHERVPTVTLRNESLRVRDGHREGALVREIDGASTVIARDRKRVLDDRSLGRNCMTCDERDCHQREAQLALIDPEER